MEIHARQNLVSLFYTRRHLRDDLVLLLKRLEDASRIVQRFLLGRGDVTDLLTIKSALDIWEDVKARIEMEYQMEMQGQPTGADDEWLDLRRLLDRMANLQELALRIGAAVDVSRLDHMDHEADLNSLTSSVQEAIRTNMAASTWTGQLKATIKPK
jgi:DNA mismatch repair ATPase MutS